VKASALGVAAAACNGNGSESMAKISAWRLFGGERNSAYRKT